MSDTAPTPAAGPALAPCPWCDGGGKPVIERDSYGNMYAFCDECGARQSEFGLEHEAQAAERWNTRAAPARSEELAALRDRSRALKATDACELFIESTPEREFVPVARCTRQERELAALRKVAKAARAAFVAWDSVGVASTGMRELGDALAKVPKP